MEPAIKQGQGLKVRLLGDSDRGRLQLGTIVAYRALKQNSEDSSEPKYVIGRVVGVGGDRIEIRNKEVWVNGLSIDESYKIHTDNRILPDREIISRFYRNRDNLAPLVVSPGSVFVMGDNRDQSYDSRHYGEVALERVIGVVEL
jgi:signal peptidase I